MQAAAELSFIRPVNLGTAVITEEAFSTDAFSTIKSIYQKEVGELSSNKAAIGFIEINNRSPSPLKCGNQTIPTGMSALFATALTRPEAPPKIDMQTALLLERRYGCITACNYFPFVTPFDQKITVKLADPELKNNLIDQFSRYLQEGNSNVEQLEARKQAIPEFAKFCNNPVAYQEELNRRTVYATETNSIFVAKL